MGVVESITRSSGAAELQRRTAGNSTPEIHAAALAAADPRPGLRWIDIGAGTGEVLRQVRDRWSPSSLVAVDVLPWLASDLRSDVELHVGDALTEAAALGGADRVLSVETLEHVDAPWALLRVAARLVMPGGVLVITTPSITTLRHRLELLVRGELTSFRAAHLQHLSPILPHVTEAVVCQEGLEDVGRLHVGRDIVPLSGGRVWPGAAARRAPSLLNISVVTVARRPAEATSVA
jgi:2-polyprenyl-3-methyl-5-hydroxy-6-metoxy-1,4-benzoquinol methylase